MSTTLRITRGDQKVFNGPVSVDKALAGATIAAMFRARLDGLALITKSIGSGITITSDVAGNRAFSIQLEPTDTNQFLTTKVTEILWDVQITYADLSGPFTLASGTLVITPDVTHA